MILTCDINHSLNPLEHKHEVMSQYWDCLVSCFLHSTGVPEPLSSPIVHWLCLSYFSLPEGRLTISRHLSWFPNRIILWVPACNTLLLLYIFTNSPRVSTFQLEPNKKQSNKIWSIEEFSNFCKVILVRNEVLLKFWINRLIAGEPQIRSYFCL